MFYYTLQVATGKESQFVIRAKQLLGQTDLTAQFIYLTREMTIRRQGKYLKQTLPLFPSYVFLEVQDQVNEELYQLLRKVPEFYHFLPSNKERHTLNEHDLSIVTHFMTLGTKIGSSLVNFDENDRIVVIEGPLKGLEGNIIKVDRRKKRAKIQLDFENSIMTIDLAFETIEKGNNKQ